MLIRDVYPQKFEGEGQEGPLAIVCHLPHLSHGRKGPVAYLVGPHCNHSCEVAVSERVVMDCMMETYRQGFRLRLFLVVYLEKSLLPEVEFAKS